MGYSMLYTCQPNESTLFRKKGKEFLGRERKAFRVCVLERQPGWCLEMRRAQKKEATTFVIASYSGLGVPKGI